MSKALVVPIVALVIVPTAASGNTISSECRYGRDAEHIVRCAAWRLEPPGGVTKALSVWRCELGSAFEQPHSDPYHGPFQYLIDTFTGQYKHIPDVARWFDIPRKVHSPRANIVTAVAWAARHGWGPWSCA